MDIEGDLFRAELQIPSSL